MKKLLIIGFTALFITISMFGTISPSLSVKAVDEQLTIQALSQSNMNLIQTYFKTNLPNWYGDYKYFVYYTTVWKVMLVPKANYAAIIFADNQIDNVNQSDIDTWNYQISCTFTSPCRVYQFNSNFSFNNTYNYTVDTYSLINFNVSFTNFSGQTYISQFVPPYQDTTVKTDLNLGNYGLYAFPSTWTETWGYTAPQTDEKQTNELIKANWGMFNFMKDFLNYCYLSVMNVLEGLAQGIADAFGTLFVASEDVLDDFQTASNDLQSSVPYLGQVNTFFMNLNPNSTATIPNVTGTVLGSEVSFNFKTAIFDPFLPVASSIQMIFKFVIWLGFLKLLWKESQTLINGAGSTVGE